MSTPSGPNFPRLLLFSVFTAATLLGTAQAKDWKSPKELALELRVFQAYVFVLTGIAVWEHIISFPFEWDIYTGRKKWRWGMACYLIIRYSIYLHLITTMININATTKVPCEVFMVLIFLSIGFVATTTSLIFVIRTVAIWRKNRYIIAFLGACWTVQFIMHFTMFYRTKQEWNPMISHCQTKFLVSKAEYNSVYLTTEITDLAAFVLSAYRLRNLNGLGLTRLLMRQGLGYFLVAFCLNTICFVFLYLNVNDQLGYINSPMAVVLSGVMGCRCFSALQREAASPRAQKASTHGDVWAGPASRRDGPLSVFSRSLRSDHRESNNDPRMSFGGFDVIQEPASTLVSPSSSPRRRPGESLKGQFDGIGLSELSYKNGTDASDAPFSRAVHMNPSPVNSIHRDVEGHQPGIAVTREVVTTVEHNVDHRIGRSSSEEDLELGQGEHRENHRSDTP